MNKHIEIDVSRIPDDKNPKSIKRVIQEEIKAGKLSSWKIERIEMQKPNPSNSKVLMGFILLTNAERPRTFSIIKKNDEKKNDEYVLTISIPSG